MPGKIYRRKKSSDFVTLDTHCIRNKNLRWASKGLHTYLFQLPDDWQINISDLENRSEDGRESTTSAMNALIESGYVVRERKHDDKGRFEGYDYYVFERPEHAIDWLSVNGKPVNGLTVNGKSETSKVLSSSKKKNTKNEERGKAKKTPPQTETYDEFMERVNKEAAEIRAFAEAKKGKKINPVAPPPSFPPEGFMGTVFSAAALRDNIGEATHLVHGVDGSTLPGALITTVEALGLHPSNPNTKPELITRMNLTQKAANGDEADAILTAWAAENIETIKLKYDRARRKFSADDLDKLIIKFTGQYASHSDAGTRERFLFDPARFFNDKLSGWLIDQSKFDRSGNPEIKKQGTPNAYGGDPLKYQEKQKF